MSSLLFAYFGPDAMLPLSSVVATLAGIFLVFGRNTTRIVRRAVPALLSRFVKSKSS